MPVSDSYLEYVIDQLGAFGHTTPRRMFGGVGLFRDGLMFALIAEDVFYLKVDDTNRDDYEGAGMEPFRPWEKSIVMSYYQVPEDVLEDLDTLRAWAEKSFAVARRKAAAKGKKRKK